MSGLTKVRFIAGAVCPRCSAMDTVRVYKRDGKNVRDCVECDFEEQENFDEAPLATPAKELPTRVNAPFVADEKKPVATQKANDVQVVKIIEGNR